MGWISDRHMRRGGSINGNTRNNGSANGPLRKIVQIISHGKTIFERDRVRFECGHEGTATIGAGRGRCRECKKTTGEKA
jgi:hypothetical protein